MAVGLHDLAQRGGEVLAGGGEMGIHLETAAEQRGRLAHLAQRHVAQPLAR